MKTKLQKKLLIMSKYAIFGIILQTILYSLVIADDGRAQKKSMEDIRISINLENLNIQDAFAKIEAASDFTFAFKRNNINLRKKLHITSVEQSLADLLRRIAKDANLKFKRVDEIIHVSRAKNRTHTVSEIISTADPGWDKIISGKVTDESGAGLPGVSIIVKGTTLGTVTHTDGTYNLEVPDNATTIVFSFVGYLTEEVEIGTRTTIDVEMVPDLTTLSEVVVVGYGTVEKRDLTGAVGKVDVEETLKTPVATIDQAIQGRVPGVFVTSVNGRGQPLLFVLGEVIPLMRAMSHFMYWMVLSVMPVSSLPLTQMTLSPLIF